jgi:hypothetical protein
MSGAMVNQTNQTIIIVDHKRGPVMAKANETAKGTHNTPRPAAMVNQTNQTKQSSLSNKRKQKEKQHKREPSLLLVLSAI